MAGFGKAGHIIILSDLHTYKLYCNITAMFLVTYVAIYILVHSYFKHDYIAFALLKF